ncbi:YkgJ family cysteine cluster protein [Campylobacter sp. faydin G-105]|uniref:YkgJ family cysteine cluster protein n=1 Tax=Campylobacter anatolicus TaxID=2829105 RepID=UPI001B9A380A|nr:YkgJ family cysteine cluster protein [Campylobacter anatolicus]MBR8462770.1 YkgJ family cysteine cluster protein [Campylobacter anatolicus]
MAVIKQQGFCYEFDTSFCDSCGGKCCTGESGYIWMDEEEMATLSQHLNLNIDEFRREFLINVGAKYSIKEKSYNGGFACVFFDEINKNCSIYEYRPSQCVSFPFWEYFLTNLKELEKECIGVRFL